MSETSVPTPPAIRPTPQAGAAVRSDQDTLGFEDTLPQVLAGQADASIANMDVDVDLDLIFDPDPEPVVDLDLDLDLDLDRDLDISLAADSASEGPLASSVALGALPSGASVATQPLVRTVSGGAPSRRVLVISADADERMYVRARLAVRRVVWLDEVSTSTQAIAAMDDVRYGLALINLDSPVIDAWALARRFREVQPQAVMVATSGVVGRVPWLAVGRRWRAWQLRRRARAEGFDALLAKPLRGRHLMALVDRLEQALEAATAVAGR
jgi:CheY-like chemotaxis protein